MIRTQIQLEEKQLVWLKKESKARGVSISQLIREGVSFFQTQNKIVPDEKKRAALAVIGRFSSGQSDISKNHDQHLAGLYGDRNRQ